MQVVIGRSKPPFSCLRYLQKKVLTWGAETSPSHRQRWESPAQASCSLVACPPGSPGEVAALSGPSSYFPPSSPSSCSAASVHCNRTKSRCTVIGQKVLRGPRFTSGVLGYMSSRVCGAQREINHSRIRENHLVKGDVRRSPDFESGL